MGGFLRGGTRRPGAPLGAALLLALGCGSFGVGPVGDSTGGLDASGDLTGGDDGRGGSSDDAGGENGGEDPSGGGDDAGGRPQRGGGGGEDPSRGGDDEPGGAPQGGRDGSGGARPTGGAGTGGSAATGGAGTGGSTATGGDDPGTGGQEPQLCPPDCEGIWYFEDFEGASLPAHGTRFGGVFDFDDDGPHGGDQALLVTLAGASSGAAIEVPAPPLGAPAKIYFRGYLKLPEAPPAGGLELLTYEGGDDQLAVAISAHPGSKVKLAAPANAGSASSDEGALVLEEWLCVQAELIVSDEVGAVRVLVDEEEVVTLSGQDTLPDGGLTVLRYGGGQPESAADGATLLWDDVAIDDAPIACL